MVVYSINYDLKAPGRDYSPLYTAIESMGSYWHELESFWLVSTDLPLREILADLLKLIDENDSLAILKVGNSCAIRSTDKGRQWLNRNGFTEVYI
jgi:hypothetical protein